MVDMAEDASSEWGARVDRRFEDRLLEDAESTQGAISSDG